VFIMRRPFQLRNRLRRLVTTLPTIWLPHSILAIAHGRIAAFGFALGVWIEQLSHEVRQRRVVGRRFFVVVQDDAECGCGLRFKPTAIEIGSFRKTCSSPQLVSASKFGASYWSPTCSQVATLRGSCASFS
jgi:hypothetical protein